MIPYFNSIPNWELILIFPMGRDLLPSQLRPITLNQIYTSLTPPSACICAIPGKDNVVNSDREFMKVCLPQWDFDRGAVRRVLDCLGFDVGHQPIIYIELYERTSPLLPMVLKALSPLWKISKDSTDSANSVRKALETL